MDFCCLHCQGLSAVGAVEVRVLIPTFRRPELLRAAIGSVLARQQIAVDIEIVVIDNDPAGSARSAAVDFSSTGAMELRYVCEPGPGISHARNTGVAASRGAYVAFLDDDETAAPLWLASFLATMEAHVAGVVVGPVRPRFPDGVPVSAYARRVYERDAQTSTGQAIQWSGIGNSLLRRDRCLAAAVPFDPQFGLSGGEDTIFLARLRERGRRLVWCAEALATEEIPADKLAPAYLLRRAFRSGQTTAFLPSALARPRWSAVARWMVIGAGQACIYGAWSIMLRLLGHEAWLGAMAKAASGLGKVMWHPALHIRNYQLGVARKPAPRTG
jgi:glycosyltransferase involved in cell wall biosynthesis